jgi:hypothetical protein
MIARFFCTTLLLLSLTGRLERSADLLVDSPQSQALESKIPATNQAEHPSQHVAIQNAVRPDVNPAQRADDQTQRVRELIYFFRTYRVFCRDEEWAQTIRELVGIGKAAVPELVAELDRTDRDATSRSLAFCLRAIGDARAVPALIRSIPKALRPPGSDCGVNISDPDLRRFMKAHQNYKDDHENSVACGRPVNEIISALEGITKHREPANVADKDPLRHVLLRGTPVQQAQQRALYEQRQKLWHSWCLEHWRDFVNQDELQTVELPKRSEDLVEMAGVARDGPLFPTGASVRLGPIRMLRLTELGYWNGKSHLDFDTGRVFTLYQGIKTADWGPSAKRSLVLSTWYQQHGIDIRCQGSIEGVDLQLWLIDNHRWDTLEAEIRKDKPLDLGREASGSLIPFEKTWIDFKHDELATILFRTREGGRGIVQMFPRDKDTDQFRVRYRMWLTGQTKPAALAPVAESVAGPRRPRSPGTPFGRIVTITLELPADDRKWFLDLKTGRKAVPPKFVNPNEIATAPSLPQDEEFTKWRRDHGIGVFGHVIAAGPEELVPAGAEPARPQPQIMLVGLDLIEARIVRPTFDELTVEEAREILGRMPVKESSISWLMVDSQLTEKPDTFAFQTREGAVGLLQIEPAEKEAGKLTIQYRLECRD